MGEYALNHRRERIKIGTCEDMYYLRYDQRALVIPQSGNVDPVKDAAELRFRFPWPDEDDHRPGEFDDFDRSLWIPGLATDPNTEHGSVQFGARAGYLISLPCPEAMPDPRIHRNGFAGAVHLVRTRYRPGIGVVPILKCGGCGAMWRVEGRSEIEEIAERLRAEGDQRQAEDERARNRANNQEPSHAGKFWHDVADRVLALAALVEG